MRTFFRGIWKPVLGGFVGVFLALAVVHLWLDHIALHQIVTMINRAPTAQGVEK